MSQRAQDLVERLKAFNNEVIRFVEACSAEQWDNVCAEVLDLLNSNGAALADYVADLDDAALNRSAHMELVGGEVSAQQLIELVIFESGGEHLANMKKALAT